MVTSVLSELAPYLGGIADHRHFALGRIDLVYFDVTGRIYSNRLRLKQDYLPIQLQPGDRLYQDPYTGEVFALPPDVPRPTPNRSQLLSRLPGAFGLVGFAAFTPPCTGTTGPFRAVYTTPGSTSARYSFQIASIALPGNGTPPGGITIIPTPPNQYNDTGYIMEGGFGGGSSSPFAPPGSINGDVDAGLQFSPTFNNYTLFIRTQAFGGFPQGVFNPYGTPDDRLVANQTIQLGFFTPAVDSVAVFANGVDTLGNPRQEVLAQQVPPNWGFSYTGLGQVMKRVTSIGQKPQPGLGLPSQSFTTGSYFGPARWQQAELCCAPCPVPCFFKTWQDSDTQSTCWWPDQAHVVTQIQDAANETDSIDLRNPPGGGGGGCPPICPMIFQDRQGP